MNIKITMMSKRSQKRAHTVLNLYKTLESADKASVTKRPMITLGWGGGNADLVGRRRVQDRYSWEGCARLGPFHSVPAPLLLLLVPEHLGCSTYSQPQGQRSRLGELRRLPSSPTRQHRGRLNTCFLLLPPPH